MNTLADNELEKLKKELIKTQANLIYSDRMSTLGQMACGIAHEISTPLATIYLKSGMLEDSVQEGTIDKAQVSKFVQDINLLVERISRIICGLKAISRDSSKDTCELISVKDIITETLEFCRMRMDKNNIMLSVSEIPLDLQIRCRSTQISQVIVNLLNNACDAVADRTEKNIKISVLNLHDKIQISVIDNGPGIPANIAHKIMQPFFTSKNAGSGTGLGLSISKGIIESHNGTISHERIADKTKFFFILPKDYEEMVML